MNRPRLLAALAAIALAVLGTVGMVSYVSGAEERAAAGQELAEVWVVTRSIPAGTPAESLPPFVSLDSVPQKLLTNSTIGELADVAGLVVEVPLLRGEVLSLERFVEPQIFERDLDRVVDLPPGYQEVTVALEPERAGGGLIVPGDTAGVIMSFNPFDVESELPVVIDGGVLPPNSKTNTTTFQTLHKVLVTNIQLENVPKVEEQAALAGEETRQVRLVPSGNLLVTFAVDVATAERIVFAAEWGTIWLTSEPADTDETPSIIQTRGTVYLDVEDDEAEPGDGVLSLDEAEPAEEGGA